MRLKIRLGPKAMATDSTDRHQTMWHMPGRAVVFALSILMLMATAVVITTPAAMARTYTAMINRQQNNLLIKLP